jgi:hypothetical protein
MILITNADFRLNAKVMQLYVFYSPFFLLCNIIHIHTYIHKNETSLYLNENIWSESRCGVMEGSLLLFLLADSDLLLGIK